MNATREGIRYLARRKSEAVQAPGVLGHLAREATVPVHMGLFYANLLLDPRICQWLRTEREVDTRIAFGEHPGGSQLPDLISKYYAYYHDKNDAGARYADDDELAVGLAILARAAAACREAPYLVPGAAGNFSRSAVGQDAIRTYILSPLEVDVLRRRGRDLRQEARVGKVNMAAHLTDLTRRYDRILVPLHNEAGMHWTLLVVARADAEAAWEAWYLDSLGDDPLDEDVALLDVLLPHVSVIPQVPRVPIQGNAVACGLHVMLAAWEVAVAPRISRVRWHTLTTTRAEQLHAVLLTVLMNCLSLLADPVAIQALGVLDAQTSSCPRVHADFNCSLGDTVVYPSATKAFLTRQSKCFKCWLSLKRRGHDSSPRRHPSTVSKPGTILDLT